MLKFGELVIQVRPDHPGRRIGIGQVGMSRFQFLQLREQSIEIAIADFGAMLYIIQKLVMNRMYWRGMRKRLLVSPLVLMARFSPREALIQQSAYGMSVQAKDLLR